MSMELNCGQCHARLRIGASNEVVVCPHCGTQLTSSQAETSSVVPPPAADAPPSPSAIDETKKAINRPSPSISLLNDLIPSFDDLASFRSRLQELSDACNPLTSTTVEQDPTPPSKNDELDPFLSHRSASLGDETGKETLDADSVNTVRGTETEGAPDSSKDRPAILHTSTVSPDISNLPPEVAASTGEDALPADSSDEPDFSWMSNQGKATVFPSNAGLAFDLSLAPEGSGNKSRIVPTAPITESAPVFRQPASSASSLETYPSVVAANPAEIRLESFALQDPASSGFIPATRTPKRSSGTLLLLVIGSYASLLTIYVIYLHLVGRQQQLESLPDLKTVLQSGGRAVVPRPENALPPGHDLQLGEARRFGNLIATPLRVTRGPLEFTHESNDPTKVREPSAPVLKLWLKFENVSTDQLIAPLDTTLMFFRRTVNNRIASYNAIFPADQRNQSSAHYLFDRMTENSNWRMVGQPTNETLAPHQSYETFVPSEEHLDDLTGKIIWRVHFRKGHGPTSGNGVTTLIDVHFQSDEITADPA